MLVSALPDVLVRHLRLAEAQVSVGNSYIIFGLVVRAQRQVAEKAPKDGVGPRLVSTLPAVISSFQGNQRP